MDEDYYSQFTERNKANSTHLRVVLLVLATDVIFLLTWRTDFFSEHHVGIYIAMFWWYVWLSFTHDAIRSKSTLFKSYKSRLMDYVYYFHSEHFYDNSRFSLKQDDIIKTLEGESFGYYRVLRRGRNIIIPKLKIVADAEYRNLALKRIWNSIECEDRKIIAVNNLYGDEIWAKGEPQKYPAHKYVAKACLILWDVICFVVMFLPIILLVRYRWWWF